MKNIQKSIRKNLIEIKESKVNLDIEKKISLSKIRFIVESNPDIENFKNLPIEKQWKIGVPLLQEIYRLQDLGFDEKVLNEESGIWGTLSKIFGGALSVGSETIFENMLSSLLKKFGFAGYLADAVIFFFARNPQKIKESFQSCNALSKNLSQAVVETYIKKLATDKGKTGVGADILRNAVLEVVENNTFAQKISDKFADITCSFFNKVNLKGSNVISAMK